MLTDPITRYWQDRTAVQQEAARAAHQTLVEKLAWQDALRRLLNLGRSRLHVLQVGSGAGPFALLLAEMGLQVTGVESSPGLVEVATQRAQESASTARFVVGAVEQPDFPPATFDAVLGVGVLALSANPGAALRAWRALVKPGGRLVIIEDGSPEPDAAQQIARLHAAQASADRAPSAAAYWRARRNRPLALADGAELAAAVHLAGWIKPTIGYLRGQLERRGRYRLQPYAVGYCTVTAEAPSQTTPSIVLPVR